MINIGLYSLLAAASAAVAQPDHPPGPAHALRRGHGGVWGIRRVAGPGEHPRQEPRRRLRHPAGRLSDRLFLAAIAFLASPWIGWRGMLALGIVPALLILYVRAQVAESPVWQAARAQAVAAPRQSFVTIMRGHWRRLAYAVLLMTCFKLLQPRHPGHLPGVPEGAAPLRPGAGHHADDDPECRRGGSAG